MVLLVDWAAYAKVPSLTEMAGMSIVTMSVLGISVCDVIMKKIVNLCKAEEKQNEDAKNQESTRV